MMQMDTYRDSVLWTCENSWGGGDRHPNDVLSALHHQACNQLLFSI